MPGTDQLSRLASELSFPRDTSIWLHFERHGGLLDLASQVFVWEAW